MRKLRHKSFTLIEMLMVLSIIALIAGVIGINMQKAFRDQRFKSELAGFVDHLRLAQDLMLIADADVHFKIEANESERSIKYWIETDKPFAKHFERFLKKVGTLKTIHHVSHVSGKDGLIDLKFLSKGSVLTSGNIQLSAAKNSEEKNTLIANVMLKGYPGPIFSSNAKNSELLETQETDDSSQILATIQEIQMINNAKKQTP